MFKYNVILPLFVQLKEASFKREFFFFVKTCIYWRKSQKREQDTIQIVFAL